jgi:hypothetical protein
MLVGRARLRRSDLMLAIEDCGPSALPIAALISFLVGLILAFVGAIQLQQFGAAIFVANLVGIAMVREMGAMMTAILMSGRLADSLSLEFTYTSRLADLLEPAFASRTAAEWERFLAAYGTAGSIITCVCRGDCRTNGP